MKKKSTQFKYFLQIISCHASTAHIRIKPQQNMVFPQIPEYSKNINNMLNFMYFSIRKSLSHKRHHPPSPTESHSPLHFLWPSPILWLSSLVAYAIACTIPITIPQPLPFWLSDQHKTTSHSLPFWSSNPHKTTWQPPNIFFSLTLTHSPNHGSVGSCTQEQTHVCSHYPKCHSTDFNHRGFMYHMNQFHCDPFTLKQGGEGLFFRHSFRSDIAPPGCSINLSRLNNDPLQKLICPVCQSTFSHKATASKHIREAHLKANNGHPPTRHPHLITPMDPIDQEGEAEQTHNDPPMATPPSRPRRLRLVANPVVVTQAPLLAEASRSSSGERNPPRGHEDNDGDDDDDDDVILLFL